MNSLFNYQSLMYQEIFKFLNNKTLKMNFLKSLKGILSVAVLMSFSILANATDETTPTINFEQVANEKVKLSVENNSSQQSFLTILNDEGQTVYYEMIKNAAYTKIFDLRILENGKYLIKVEFDNRIVKQNATLQNNLLTLEALETVAKPVFTVEGNSVSVQLSDVKQNEVAVRITNENGYACYEKTETTVGNFGKLYVLNELVHGDYTVYVTVNDIVYSKYITVK